MAKGGDTVQVKVSKSKKVGSKKSSKITPATKSIVSADETDEDKLVAGETVMDVTHKGKSINPLTTDKNPEPESETELSVPETDDEKAAAAGRSDYADDSPGDDLEATTLDKLATIQHQPVMDTRDYKISKKQLKRPPRVSGVKRHHQTTSFVLLVSGLSLLMALLYLTVVADLSIDQIITKLGI